MPRPTLLLLHGIRGARLTHRTPSGREVIWSLEQELHPDSHLLALGSTPEGRALPLVPGTVIEAGPLEQEIYRLFCEATRDRFTLLAPPWDWRLAPAQAVEALEPLLAQAGPLDLVTHSMGLLVLLECLDRGLLKPDRLGRVVLVTPPFCGSADVVSLLARGIDCSADDGLGERRYDHCLARSFPALYRLLPGADCQACRRDWLAEETWTSQLPDTPALRDPFLLELARARADRQRWAGALERLVSQAGSRLLILAGRGTPTLLDPDHPGGISTEGDGRLPLCSTRPAGLELPRVVLGAPGDPVKHGEILNDDRARRVILDWLEGQSPLASGEGWYRD